MKEVVEGSEGAYLRTVYGKCIVCEKTYEKSSDWFCCFSCVVQYYKKQWEKQ